MKVNLKLFTVNIYSSVFVVKYKGHIQVDIHFKIQLISNTNNVICENNC